MTSQPFARAPFTPASIAAASPGYPSSHAAVALTLTSSTGKGSAMVLEMKRQDASWPRGTGGADLFIQLASTNAPSTDVPSTRVEECRFLR